MTEDTQNPAQTVAASPLVWVLQVLLAVPVTGVVLVLTRSWVPHGDLAIIAMHTRDVFSFHPPMLGMPSTGFLIVEGNDAHHLGPLQFHSLAIPYRLAGGAPWMLLIASAVLILGLMALGVMATSRSRTRGR